MLVFLFVKEKLIYSMGALKVVEAQTFILCFWLHNERQWNQLNTSGLRPKVRHSQAPVAHARFIVKDVAKYVFCVK
jgi:hypothetical protein